MLLKVVTLCMCIICGCSGSHVIHVVTSIQTISTIQTGREGPECSSDVLSSCDLNLSTEQEDTMRIYLSNLLNIFMEHHLKLL